jgi:hypothetical protein
MLWKDCAFLQLGRLYSYLYSAESLMYYIEAQINTK